MIRHLIAIAVVFTSISPAVSLAQWDTAQWNIGTRVDSFRITVMGASHSSELLSNYHGKLAVLQFWNVRNTNCERNLSKLEELQKRFKDSIVIMLVNMHDDTVVQDYLKRRKSRHSPSITLHIVSKTSGLDKVVPFKYPPHFVWIDDKSQVIAITGDSAVNRQNISAALHHELGELPRKKDTSLDWYTDRLLFRNGNGGNGEALRFSSLLSGYVEGLPGNSFISVDSGQPPTAFVTNMDIRTLYGLAYQPTTDRILMSLPLPMKQMAFENTDTTKIVKAVNRQRVNENLYCYQLLALRLSYAKLKRLMQEDLRKYFEFRVRVVKKKMDCMVLSCSDTALLRTTGETYDLLTDDSTYITLKNIEFGWIKRQIVETWNDVPFIDETNKFGLVDMQLICNLKNITSFDKALSKYGLHLTKQERLVDVYVFSAPEQFKLKR